MIYSVVDIETTGSKPGQNKITEIAIVKTDGTRILEEYSTLIHPETNIPYFITQMTGITNQMVASAPKFYEVAKEIYEHLKNTIFVAHNARFDYGFLKEAFLELGFNLQLQTLCTVRLARDCFPGLKSYSLGKLCNELRIPIQNRHRALGDAKATTILLEKIISSKGHPANFSIKNESKKTILPPNLESEQVKSLPEAPGVYYFLNQKNQIVYIGKSLNIKKRVKSHFQFKSSTSKKPKLFDDIHNLSFEIMGNELMALLHEASQIKTHKPRHNKALKRTRYPYAIDIIKDEQGYLNLKLKPQPSAQNPLLLVGSQNAGTKLLEKWIETHKLHPQFLNLPHLATKPTEPPTTYNFKVENLIQRHTYPKKNALLIGRGRTVDERSIVLIENNNYLGKGFFSEYEGLSNIDDAKQHIELEEETPDHKKVILSLWKSKDYKKITF